MPWHTSNLLQQREAFVQLAEASGQYFSDLCRSFGISRQTGYKWLARHRESAGAVIRENRQWRIHPDKSYKAFCKLVEHSALVVTDNLLLRRRGFRSDKDGSIG
jgi:transposase-like protein